MAKCPLCEQEASATAAIKMQNDWRDTFGKPPHSLFSEYVMVHIGPDETGQQTAYLHSERDLQR